MRQIDISLLVAERVLKTAHLTSNTVNDSVEVLIREAVYLVEDEITAGRLVPTPRLFDSMAQLRHSKGLPLSKASSLLAMVQSQVKQLEEKMHAG